MEMGHAAMLTECVRRGGYRAGRRVAQFVTEWGLAVRSTGGPITTEQFASFWHENPATSYRRLSQFRLVFPELGREGLPQDLMTPLLDRLAAGERSIPDLGLVLPA